MASSSKSSVSKDVSPGKKKFLPAQSLDVPTRDNKAVWSSADTLVGQRKSSYEDNDVSKDMSSTLLRSDDGAYRAVKALTPLMLDDIKELDREMKSEDAELAMLSRSLHLALENFVTLEHATSLFNKKFHMMKDRLRETESALSSARDEVRDQTLLADSREEEMNGLKAKLGDLEKDCAFLRESLLAAKAEHEKVNQEIAQVRVEAKAKEKELLESNVAHALDLINKEVFQAHCRSLTLAGVAPGDPLWIDCWFPYEGARPTEWEAMMASSAGISFGHLVQQWRNGIKPKIENKSDTTPEIISKKNMNDNGNEDKIVATSKQPSCEEQSGIKVVTEKGKPEKEELQPTDAELRYIISGILFGIDIGTVTVGDVLKFLAKRYKSDFTSRKFLIESMIKEERTYLKELEDTENDDETGIKVMTGKEKPEKEKIQPTDAELRNIISEILIVIDTKTATFGDIYKILELTITAERYKSDFISRKSLIKSMIKDEFMCLEELEDTDDDDETAKAMEKVTVHSSEV